ncbi:MFS transporter [Botrimarina hoheduenensis]|uniref:Inner membrane symporter YicJ n=1 Tax=Botrimarina hoheduenensis TaxID=2528000 RepID=A0A5C5WDF3_9BACT|nr:MFS transporter [Botrimarina hoheduenensis]TWT47712.1 Inner membrane symporter YicJ [Botrimarina hoheduenensis]
MKATQKLSLTEKVGYGLGDCAANFVFQTQLIFLMSFYTDVLGISSLTVAAIFLYSRLWDAVNDPLIGALADRTNTRWGKFRPWIVATAIPFALCFILAYTTPDLSATGKVIWACVTYNLLMMVYTANNIPYAALTGVITADPVERTSLTAWRFLLAMTAAFMVQTYTLDLVQYLGAGDTARGYQLTMTFWALLAVLLFVITFATTKERVRPPVEQRNSFTTDLKDLATNRSWVALAVLTLFYFIYLSMRGGVGIYYFRYVIQQEAWFGWFNGAGMLASMLGILFSKSLSIRFGKRNVFILSQFVAALITATFYVAPEAHVGLIVGLQCLLQLVYGVSIPLLWAMMADVADLSEWRTGRRATAMTFAATVFALKLGLSIGGALSGWLLNAYGYVPNAAQSADAIEGIRLMMSLFPAIAFLVGAGVLFFYEIDRELEGSLCDRLQERRAFS